MRTMSMIAGEVESDIPDMLSTTWEELNNYRLDVCKTSKGASKVKVKLMKNLLKLLFHKSVKGFI